MQRASFWRRGTAALVDMALALVLLQAVAVVGFQLTGGRVTSGLSLTTDCTSARATGADLDMPRGASLPDGMAPDRVALCRSGLLGATMRLDYVLSRTEPHVGLDVTTSYAIPVYTSWRAAGGRVDLDPFLLPLFVLVRWAFDRFAGATPGRALTRTRVAERESAGARVGVALGRDLDRRYLLFAAPYAPILAIGIAQALYGIAMGGPSLVLGRAAVGAVAVALASQLVAAASIARGRSAFYDRSCAIAIEQGVTDTDTSRAFAFEAERIVGHNLFVAGGDLSGAIDIDTRALDLRSMDVGLLKQRAEAEFYGGQPAEALADLDAVLPDAPGDAEAILWREIVARRLGRASRLGVDTFSVDGAGWPGAIVALYRGRSSPEELRARVLDFDLSRWVEHRCDAEFFIGEWHVIRGEADAARAALRDALRDCPGTATEAHAAEYELLGRAGFE